MKIKYNKLQAENKAPSSLSFEKDNTPRLGGKDDIIFNNFTTKHISSQIKEFPNVFNTYTNGKLAYKRAPRKSDHNYPTKIKWGPSAFKLTTNNYKNLKKNQRLYFDRGSVYFRGPIFFDGLLRGPKLKLKAKDFGYDNTYTFILDIKNIDDFLLYAVQNKTKNTKNKSKNKSKTKSKTKSKKYKKTKRNKKNTKNKTKKNQKK